MQYHSYNPLMADRYGRLMNRGMSGGCLGGCLGQSGASATSKTGAPAGAGVASDAWMYDSDAWMYDPEMLQVMDGDGVEHSRDWGQNCGDAGPGMCDYQPSYPGQVPGVPGQPGTVFGQVPGVPGQPGTVFGQVPGVPGQPVTVFGQVPGVPGATKTTVPKPPTTAVAPAPAKTNWMGYAIGAVAGIVIGKLLLG